MEVEAKLQTPLDGHLASLFGTGRKGSCKMLATVLLLTSAFRLLYLLPLSQPTPLSGCEEDALLLPLAKKLTQMQSDFLALIQSEASSNWQTAFCFTLRTLEHCLLTMPFTLVLLEHLNPRLSFKLRLTHFAVLSVLTSPIAFMWVKQCTLHLAYTLLIATLAFLAIDCPLLASVTIALAVNLDLSLSLYLPIFLVYAFANIIANSPSANIVKQVDYIVWRVIFLILNLACVSLAIWWPLIVN